MVLLYPNDYSGSNLVKSGTIYSVPSEKDFFELIASEPAGIDTIIVFFTRRKVDWLDPKVLRGSGFKTVAEGEKYFASRAITLHSKKINRRDWKSVEVTIEVRNYREK